MMPTQGRSQKGQIINRINRQNQVQKCISTILMSKQINDIHLVGHQPDATKTSGDKNDKNSHRTSTTSKASSNINPMLSV
jgi:hypothetical protein